MKKNNKSVPYKGDPELSPHTKRVRVKIFGALSDRGKDGVIWAGPRWAMDGGEADDDASAPSKKMSLKDLSASYFDRFDYEELITVTVRKKPMVEKRRAKIRTYPNILVDTHCGARTWISGDRVVGAPPMIMRTSRPDPFH